jgi:hypothetical protein
MPLDITDIKQDLALLPPMPKSRLDDTDVEDPADDASSPESEFNEDSDEEDSEDESRDEEDRLKCLNSVVTIVQKLRDLIHWIFGLCLSNVLNKCDFGIKGFLSGKLVKNLP